jgi:hypothetical protein
VRAFGRWTSVNCHHNYTELEEHDGKWLWVTRKGAISAGVGDRGLIPARWGRSRSSFGASEPTVVRIVFPRRRPGSVEDEGQEDAVRRGPRVADGGQVLAGLGRQVASG